MFKQHRALIVCAALVLAACGDAQLGAATAPTAPATHGRVANAFDGFGGQIAPERHPAGGDVTFMDFDLDGDGTIAGAERGEHHFCGAVLITPTISVTAAHCVDALLTRGKRFVNVRYGDEIAAVNGHSMSPAYAALTSSSAVLATPGLTRDPLVGTTQRGGALSIYPSGRWDGARYVRPSYPLVSDTSYRSAVIAGADLAIITHAPIRKTEPARIAPPPSDALASSTLEMTATGPSEPADGVGFERGVRRVITVPISSVSAPERSYSYHPIVDGKPYRDVTYLERRLRFAAVIGGGAGFLSCKGDSGSGLFDAEGRVVGVTHGFSTAFSRSDQTVTIEDEAWGQTKCNPVVAFAHLASPAARDFVCNISDDLCGSLQQYSPGYCQ